MTTINFLEIVDSKEEVAKHLKKLCAKYRDFKLVFYNERVLKSMLEANHFLFERVSEDGPAYAVRISRDGDELWCLMACFRKTSEVDNR